MFRLPYGHVFFSYVYIFKRQDKWLKSCRILITTTVSVSNPNLYWDHPSQQWTQWTRDLYFYFYAARFFPDATALSYLVHGIKYGLLEKDGVYQAPPGGWMAHEYVVTENIPLSPPASPRSKSQHITWSQKSRLQDIAWLWKSEITW